MSNERRIIRRVKGNKLVGEEGGVVCGERRGGVCRRVRKKEEELCDDRRKIR